MNCPRCKKTVDNNAISCSSCGMETPDAGFFYGLDAYNSWKSSVAEGWTKSELVALPVSVFFPFVSGGSVIGTMLPSDIDSMCADPDMVDRIISMMTKRIESDSNILEYRLVRLLCETGYVFEVELLGIRVTKHFSSNTTPIFTSDDFRTMIRSMSSDSFKYINLLEKLDRIRTGNYEEEIEAEEATKKAIEKKAPVRKAVVRAPSLEKPRVVESAPSVVGAENQAKLAENKRKTRFIIGMVIVTVLVVMVIFALNSGNEGQVTRKLRSLYKNADYTNYSLDKTNSERGYRDLTTESDVKEFMATRPWYDGDGVTNVFSAWDSYSSVDCLTFKDEAEARKYYNSLHYEPATITYDNNTNTISGRYAVNNSKYRYYFEGVYNSYGWFTYGCCSATYLRDNEVIMVWAYTPIDSSNLVFNDAINNFGFDNVFAKDWASIFVKECQY